jgi:6-phosphofructokinase 2
VEHKLRCTDTLRDPGGGAINVARVLKRLGADCRALYPAGGVLGQLLRALLDAEGVAGIAFDIAAETRESFTVLERASGREFRFVLPGPELSKKEWQACLDRVAALAEPPAYLVASGSLPPGVPDDLYARLARIARERGSRMVLDASGRALAAALEEGVYLVKPNLRELRELTGQALEAEDEWSSAASPLVTSGKAQVVALSLGHRGRAPRRGGRETASACHSGADCEHRRRRRQLPGRDGLAAGRRRDARGCVPLRRRRRHRGPARAGHEPRARGGHRAWRRRWSCAG